MSRILRRHRPPPIIDPETLFVFLFVIAIVAALIVGLRMGNGVAFAPGQG